ncbi:PREDICTED: transmembrane protein 261 isoform X1 [Miniopterus natalensis]|uniref:transmembrane protein 261 isoform X1 n=1 Tax=Miniopterus natalensis TaxID=291302 RepID=UPI0007A6C0F1|nr:PREDICTED: transmembrane protein 261 isoform X1 [Miniopterus natalensis]
MGSFASQPLETVKVGAPPEAAPPANPAPLQTSEAPTSPEQPPLFNNCWSCRVVSGAGLIWAGGHCLLGCSHPVRPQREGLPRCLKVPPVNLSSVPVPVTHRASMGLMDVLDRHMDTDILQFCRYYKTEKTNISWHSLAMSVCGLLGLHKDQ